MKARCTGKQGRCERSQPPKGGLPFGNRKTQTQTGHRGWRPSLHGDASTGVEGSRRTLRNVLSEPHRAYADEACLYADETVCMQMRRKGILFSGLP